MMCVVISAGLPALLFGALILRAMGRATPLRLVAMVCLFVLALLATAGGAFFFDVGSTNHWRSDGPGMLFIMIACAVCGATSLVSWLSLAVVIGSTPSSV